MTSREDVMIRFDLGNQTILEFLGKVYFQLHPLELLCSNLSLSGKAVSGSKLEQNWVFAVNI